MISTSHIVKGSENSNADALSRQMEQGDSHTAAIAMESLFLNELKHHQSQDAVLCKLHDALLHSSTPPITWSQPPLNRYRQLSFCLAFNICTK